MLPRPAVFLDRDGVIVEEIHYLDDPDRVRLLPGAAAAIAELNYRNIPVVVITNQSGVARGRFPEATVAAVHQRLEDLLEAAGASIDRYYYCPHHPTEGTGAYRVECDCRKPRPGMLLKAAADLRLDLPRSYLVGDQLSDLEAGWAAGCRAVLVRTGYGAKQALQLAERRRRPDAVAADLLEAVRECLPALERAAA